MPQFHSVFYRNHKGFYVYAVNKVQLQLHVPLASYLFQNFHLPMEYKKKSKTSSRYVSKISETQTEKLLFFD